mgnify:CR=1 FL=1
MAFAGDPSPSSTGPTPILLSTAGLEMLHEVIRVDEYDPAEPFHRYFADRNAKADHSMMRRCKACGVEKPSTDFYVNGQPNGARKKTCKECDKAKLKEVRRLRSVGSIPPKKPKKRLETNAEWIESNLRGSCKSKGRELKLSLDEIDVIIHQPCYYCGGTDTRQLSRGRTGRFNSIDRLDSNGDYSPSNVVSCCAMCNIMKNRFTPEEFVAQCQAIVANSQAAARKNT